MGRVRDWVDGRAIYLVNEAHVLRPAIEHAARKLIVEMTI